MRLVKIKNRYLFNSSNPNGYHTYAVYYDKVKQENHAVALTHLYVKDNKRFKQVRKGNIMVTRFQDFDTPTGVQNYYYSKNRNNNKINLKDKDVIYVSKNYLSKKQSSAIKNFAVRDYNK